MVQNKSLFSATRIPGSVQDTVRAPYSEQWPGPSDTRHIVVFHRGNLFHMDVIGPDGRPHTLDDKECQAGQAPEQHLWELQFIQKRRGGELGVTEPLELFESPGWLKMRDDYLSTSSAPSPHVQYSGFGSASGRCIGIGYVLLPERFDLHLSAPLAVADELSAFVDRLREAVRELQDLLAIEEPEAARQ